MTHKAPCMHTEISVLVSSGLHPKDHRLGVGVGLIQQKFTSSQFWKWDVRDQGISRLDFFWGRLSLACRWHSSPCFFTRFSFYASLRSKSSPCKFAILDEGSPKCIHFTLITFLKSVSPDTVAFWGTSRYEFWKDTIQPLTISKTQKESGAHSLQAERPSLGKLLRGHLWGKERRSWMTRGSGIGQDGVSWGREKDGVLRVVAQKIPSPPHPFIARRLPGIFKISQCGVPVVAQ